MARLKIVGIVIVAILASVFSWLWWEYRRKKQKREQFFLPLLGVGLTAAGVGIGATGLDKKITEKMPWGKTGGGGGGAAPTYRGRYKDSATGLWVCPDESVETGWEDAKACITSQYHPPVWKAGSDGKWDHLCPNGTAPTAENDWNKKCEVGWTSRVYSEDIKKWACPWGTWDSGKDWKDGWHEGHKQCKRNKPYTTQILKDGKWQCPLNTKSTGKGWEIGKDNGWKQCQYTGP